MNWDDVFTCPICGSDQYVPPSGKEDSPVLIIGEFPGDEEIKRGVPMVGAMGGVLKSELRKLGLDLSYFRLANLWFHPEYKGKDNSKCLEYFMQELIKEAQGKQAILLMGSDTVKEFCNKKVSAVCGLQVQSHLITSVPIIYACVNPATVFHSSIGEMRLALTKFVQRLEKEEIL